MQRRSWILLGICAALLACLGFGYYLAQAPPPELNQARAEKMLEVMKDAVRRKEVSTLMSYVAPDSEARLAGLKPDQMRIMLARAFRSTGRLEPETSNVTFQNSGKTATLEFDLNIKSRESDMLSTPYSGRVILRLKQVEVPRLLGLFHGTEWRIASAEHTGRDLNSFGDY
jgi:hypothetical protein